MNFYQQFTLSILGGKLEGFDVVVKGKGVQDKDFAIDIESIPGLQKETYG